MNASIFRSVEWPTLALILACYGVWFALAFLGHDLAAPFWIAAIAIVTTLYWSLVHEVVHCHPTRNARLNHALVWIPIGWVYALGRFRDGHLEHHATGALTDPFDDPESWYLPQGDWRRAGPLTRRILTLNNTLAGRMTIGPAIVFWRMLRGDLALALRGGPTGRRVMRDWALHAPAILILVWLIDQYSQVPAWQFAAAAYCGVSILLIRTFIEHQAAEDAGERTVIIEDYGPLAFLFLFNNLHVVHHTRPGLAWYRLPGFYRRHRQQFIRRNRGYVYPSYAAVFRRYFLTPKEPVPHPHAL